MRLRSSQLPKDNVPDSRILAPLADTLALVVRAEQTPRRAVTEAVNILDGSGVLPDGAILNASEDKSFLGNKNKYDYGYGGYGYGQAYGTVYGEED